MIDRQNLALDIKYAVEASRAASEASKALAEAANKRSPMFDHFTSLAIMRHRHAVAAFSYARGQLSGFELELCAELAKKHEEAIESLHAGFFRAQHGEAS